MGVPVEDFSETQEEHALEEDLLETSWKRYHAEIAAVQRDIALLRSEVARRLALVGMEEMQRDPASCWAMKGWLQQQTRNCEVRLRGLLLCAMRECALERARRAQAIRRFCAERAKKDQGILERPP